MIQGYAKYFFALTTLLFSLLASANTGVGTLVGKVLTTSGDAIDYANVYLKGTAHYTTSNEDGKYKIEAPAGHYMAVYSSVGYESREVEVTIQSGQFIKKVVKLAPTTELKEVVVTTNTLNKVRNSAFNATAIDAKRWSNSNKNLSDALNKAPGVKIRQSGGVGSDMAVTMDGFSGRHVKVFIDGVPQEGASSAMGLNNIPVGYADRIEVYRGVVPVKFGADAIGGVINIVTPRNSRRWWLDASYSGGSFNTHRSNVRFGQRFKNGLNYELNAFQNYSDNSYWIDAPVEDFNTGAINRRKPEHVRRFHDNYHNEAIVAKIGIAEKFWADRMAFGLSYSRMYKEIQTGVRQEIVYGGKHRHGYSFTPTFEYSKTIKSLSVNANASMNINRTTNVDTSSVKYNWRGETSPLNSPGEQSYQYAAADSRNWNTAVIAVYRINENQEITLSNLHNGFHRRNRNLLAAQTSYDEIAKQTSKNISGLSYMLRFDKRAQVSAFAKLYHQSVAGPLATSAAQDSYVRTSHTVNHPGYGMAATWFAPWQLQLKLSYERACRLPTIEEIFGDEDLETGDIGIKPETSHNVNLNLSKTAAWDKNNLYVESSLIFRDTRDYIQRNILALSGGKSAAQYINYGKVLTTGISVNGRYSRADWLSIGLGTTWMNVRDNMPTAPDSNKPNLAYGERMPNQPWLFADGDITLKYRGASLIYEGQFTKSFCYYASNIGSNRSDYMVPDQLAHNVSLNYAIQNGRYNISLECRNLTDARLYDNFSLQKAGRAFYAKFRIHFSE